MDINILQWKYKRRSLLLGLSSDIVWFLWTPLVLSVCVGTGHIHSCELCLRQNVDVCTSAEANSCLPDDIMTLKIDKKNRAINSTGHYGPLLRLEPEACHRSAHCLSPWDRANVSAHTEIEASTPSAGVQQDTSLGDMSIDKDSLPLSQDNRDKPTVQRSSDQDKRDEGNINCSAIRHNFTLVTALINLHRQNWTYFKRSFEHYLFFSIQLLKMNAPLVIYVEPSAVDFVNFHRQGKEHQTKIIETSIEDLEYHKDIHKIREIMNSEDFKTDHPFVRHPEGFSAEYNILMNSKFSMLSEAAYHNVFNSSHFYWTDMAYGHGDSSVFPEDCGWQPANIMYNESLTDKITYIAINNMSLLTNIYQIYKKDIPPFLSGGFFGGSAKAVTRYYQIHRNMFSLFLQHQMVDDDQTLAILCYFADTSLFHFVSGWWFDAFKLFH